MSNRGSRAGDGSGHWLEATRPWVSWVLQRMANQFMAQTAHYPELSGQTLDRLLALNGATEFGRRRGLDGPGPRRVFETLPITSYVDYAPYVARLAAGERHLLSSQRVAYFATTSGTTGPPKMVPVTGEQMRANLRSLLMTFGLAVRQGILTPMRGRAMVLLTEHTGGITAGKVPRGAAITGSFRFLGGITDAFITAPMDVMRVHDQASARYLQLLFALGEERLWTLLAFFPTVLLFALRDLEYHAPRLVRDLADGRLDPGLELPAAVRDTLRRRLRPQRARARALTALLDQDRFTVPNIWPEASAVLTASGGSFRFYIDQLRPLLDGLPVYSPVYGASEALIGFGYSVQEPWYLLVPTLNYIELLPEADIGNPQARPIPAWEAKTGGFYEVVVTTPAGFTRYRMHDMVRVVKFMERTPVVEFVERTGQVLDVLGEKTAEHHVVAAMADACSAVAEPLVDYFVAADLAQAPPRYVLAVEGWHNSPEDRERAGRLVGAVEVALRQASPDYDEERALGTLGAMKAVVLRPGAFERYRDRRVTGGASGTQLKTPHVMIDPEFLAREFGHEIELRVRAGDVETQP